MKIIITGTHFTPALAVIDELRRVPDIDVVYIGRESTLEGDNTRSVESKVMADSGVKFIPLISGRFQRNLTIHTIPSLLKIPIGFLQSIYHIFKECPDVILSFGGYISVPVVFAAWLFSIPIIIHEQTLIPGLANIINSWFADRIAVSFPENTTYEKKKTVLTGNPLRKEIYDPKNSEDNPIRAIINLSSKNKQPLILVTGGNQGSHIINQTILKSLEDLTKIANVVHQTGDSKFADFDHLLDRKKTLHHPEKYLIQKWINSDDWGFLLKHVDLAVSRAGINTLLEFAYNSIPTLVVPLPSIYNKEQSFNAEFFEKSGLAKILPQTDLSEKNLKENIQNIIDDLDARKKSAEQSSKFAIKDAAKRLALEVILLAKKRR